MYLILTKEHFTFHLQYKHSGTFANCKYEDQLSYPKYQKMCDPILVTLLKMRLHVAAHLPLAAFKEVSAPPGHLYQFIQNKKKVPSVQIEHLPVLEKQSYCSSNYFCFRNFVN